MGGEAIEETVLTERGVVGDRAYALIDTESGKVISAKSAKRFPGILDCSAAFIEPPGAQGTLAPVRISLPNGTSLDSDSASIHADLSVYFGREVTLARVAPDDFAIEQYIPDVEHADPSGRRDIFVDRKLGASLFAELGMPSPIPAGSFFDAFPLSLLTTSTIAHLSAAQPQSRFDQRRFRMNVFVRTDAAGFVENDWVGQGLVIGDEVRIQVGMAAPRCVVTTLAQAGLPRDLDVLRTLVRLNRIPVANVGRLACAGVYAVVTEPGTVRVGDWVTLE